MQIKYTTGCQVWQWDSSTGRRDSRWAQNTRTGEGAGCSAALTPTGFTMVLRDRRDQDWDDSLVSRACWVSGSASAVAGLQTRT